MASVLKVDRIETPSGTGNISLAQPLSGDGSQLTGITAGTPADDSITGAKIDLSLVGGDIMYASAPDTLERLPKGTDGELLTLASGVPSWVAGSTPADDSITGAKIDLSLVAGDIIYSDATDSIERLAKGTDGEVLTLASGVPSWASAGGGGSGAWEYVEKVIPTTAVSILVLQQNMTVGYDYLVTWERIRHQSDTMLTCHLMNGSGTPVQVSSGNLGISHYVGQASYHDYQVQATDEFHVSRVNASGGGSAEDQWWGSMMLINPGAALETSGWFEGGMRNAQYIFSTSGHWINDTAEAITGLTFGGYGAMTAQGEFISYRRKRS